MKTSEFHYDLPEDLIAQHPVTPRDGSRLLVFNRNTREIFHKHFYDITDYIGKDDVLVINNTRVIPARLYGNIKGKQAKIEVLLLEKKDLNSFDSLVKPGKKVKVGDTIIFSHNLSATVVAITETGGRILNFKTQQGSIESELDRIGEMPLPHYIKEKLTDSERYQTIYSRKKGSSAAPTAGLHFTPELMQRIKDKGTQIEEVLLHVGLGTFRPVKVEDVTKHVMHSEHYEVTEDTAKRLNEAKRQGKRIIAVGTTTVRTLETTADDKGIVHAGTGSTNIFIYPGYKFKFIDAIITNFHLPESTLIMLISAFAGKDNVMKVYQTAVKERYRFFSFGDSCFFM